MYAFIRGTLVSTTPLTAVIDANGVGYEIYIPASLLGNLPDLQSECLLYTSFIVREQIQALYGFLSQSEKQVFEVFLSISGVGPKLALALIGHLTLEELQDAICHENPGRLQKVPGVGKRTAERLIIELRDKLPTLFSRDSSTVSIEAGNPKSQVLRDAVSALINLGYQQHAARKAIKLAMADSDEEIPLPELISAALSKF